MRSAEAGAAPQRPGVGGFTLVELLVTVAVLGIVLAMGIPQLMRSTAGSRLDAQADRLASAVRLARSEAVKRSATVTLCPTLDGATCADGAGWEMGFLVRAMQGNDPVVVEVWPAAPAEVLMRGVGTLSLAATGTLSPAGSVKVCGTSVADAGHAVQLTLTATARASRQTVASAACP